MQLQTKQLWILAVLALLMVFTRYNHFGSSVSLPDASLAVFLLAGFFMGRSSWISLATFTFLILVAGAVDYYAINVVGVSDWCVTPAYWFLIPTYASMWFGGRWFAIHQGYTLNSLALFMGVSWITTTTAFLISNASFFLLSGRYAEMNAVEYTGRVTQYYAPYLAGSMMYLALAAVVYIFLHNLGKTTSDLSHL
jgi:hypothetical protein